MQITKKGRENTFSQHYAYRFVGEVQVLSDHYSPKAGIIILLSEFHMQAYPADSLSNVLHHPIRGHGVRSLCLSFTAVVVLLGGRNRRRLCETHDVTHNFDNSVFILQRNRKNIQLESQLNKQIHTGTQQSIQMEFPNPTDAV